VNQNWNLLTGMAVGAGLMFMLDPRAGRRRRALMRDKMVRAAHKTSEGLDALSRDAANRARGIAAESQSRMRSDSADARTLVERVRAELGRVVSHPRAIDVSASDDGSVCLMGPILAGEAEPAMAAIASVRGVTRVEDQLQRDESAEGIPSLQGGRMRPGQRMLMDWSPARTLLVCATGGALAAGWGYASHARHTSH